MGHYTNAWKLRKETGKPLSECLQIVKSGNNKSTDRDSRSSAKSKAATKKPAAPAAKEKAAKKTTSKKNASKKRR